MFKQSFLAFFSAALLFTACGGESSGPTESAGVEPKKEDVSSNPDYKKGLALVANNNCLTCHAINQTTTGPSYADIAAKYAGADDAQVTSLARKIIEGGMGVWGQVPMIPHPTLTEDEARAMVKYILLLKK